MNALLIVLVVFLIIAIGLGLLVMMTYNRLVDLRNRVKNAFSQIDVQLRRKHDLIPNMVEAVKAYMGHEKEVLQKVTEARAGACQALDKATKDPSNPAAIKDLIRSEGVLNQGLAGFRLTVENYPELKANENMLNFQNELSGTENRVAFSRQAFNDAVMFYNNRRQSFPTVVFAGIFGFQDAEPFEITGEERNERLKVSF